MSFEYTHVLPKVVEYGFHSNKVHDTSQKGCQNGLNHLIFLTCQNVISKIALYFNNGYLFNTYILKSTFFEKF